MEKFKNYRKQKKLKKIRTQITPAVREFLEACDEAESNYLKHMLEKELKSLIWDPIGNEAKRRMIEQYKNNGKAYVYPPRHKPKKNYSKKEKSELYLFNFVRSHLELLNKCGIGLVRNAGSIIITNIDNQMLQDIINPDNKRRR